MGGYQFKLAGERKINKCFRNGTRICYNGIDKQCSNQHLKLEYVAVIYIELTPTKRQCFLPVCREIETLSILRGNHCLQHVRQVVSTPCLTECVFAVFTQVKRSKTLFE